MQFYQVLVTQYMHCVCKTPFSPDKETDTVTNQIHRQAAVKLYVAGKLDALTK